MKLYLQIPSKIPIHESTYDRNLGNSLPDFRGNATDHSLLYTPRTDSFFKNAVNFANKAQKIERAGVTPVVKLRLGRLELYKGDERVSAIGIPDQYTLFFNHFCKSSTDALSIIPEVDGDRIGYHIEKVSQAPENNRVIVASLESKITL